MPFFKTRYDKNAKRRRAEKAAEAANAASRPLERVAADALAGKNTGDVLTGTTSEREGQLAGLNLGNLGYGQGLAQTGQDIQKVKQLQSDRTAQSGADPVSAAIMGQKAGAMANAQRNLAASGVKGGGAAGAVDNVGRAANQDIAASLYGQQAQSLGAERSLASNMLAGQTSLMQGGGAGKDIPSAPKSTSFMDSVICTELHRQGLMSTPVYMLDAEYGKLLKEESPHVVIGYHFLAKPIVKLMRKSKFFTKLISYPALKWAHQIAGIENSITGSLIFNVGQPICGIIGKLIISGEKYVLGNN